MALVFQEYSRSLFPWMTVRQNVAFPLCGASSASRTTARLVEEALGAVGLGDAMDRYPWQLSGGMQQRVAIARALAYQPRILLMDEPFASVDAQTRADLEDLVLQVRQHYDVTIVFVTHDIDESVYLSDRIIVLDAVADAGAARCSRSRCRDRATRSRPRSCRSSRALRAHVWRSIKRPDGARSRGDWAERLILPPAYRATLASHPPLDLPGLPARRRLRHPLAAAGRRSRRR